MTDSLVNGGSGYVAVPSRGGEGLVGCNQVGLPDGSRAVLRFPRPASTTYYRVALEDARAGRDNSLSWAPAPLSAKRSGAASSWPVQVEGPGCLLP